MNLWNHQFYKKMTRKIWRISALRVFIVHRAEILQIFWVIFWKIDDFINPFWLNLTFTRFNLKVTSCLKLTQWILSPNKFVLQTSFIAPNLGYYSKIAAIIMALCRMERACLMSWQPQLYLEAKPFWNTYWKKG